MAEEGGMRLSRVLSGIMKDYTMELVRENRRYPRSMAEKQVRSKRTVNRVFPSSSWTRSGCFLGR